jgi:hypothetical protein
MKIANLSRDAARGMRIQQHSHDVNLFITQYIISILIIPLINLLLTKENTTTQ